MSEATRTIVQAVAEKTLENLCNDCEHTCTEECNNLLWVYRNIIKCGEEK